MDRKTLDHITSYLLRPLAIRIQNLAARVIVQAVRDGEALQGLQVGALAGEDIDDAESFQPYGFTSVPLVGAEGVAIFPNGDRGHPLVVVVSDRRSRPTGMEQGEVAVYHKDGAIIKFTKDGDITVMPKSGRNVLIGTSGDPLVKRSEFLGHGHATAGTGAPSAPITVTPPASSATFPGTTKMKAE